MKAVIYYSLSGRTKKELEDRFEGDFYRIKGKTKIPKAYWMQLAWLGMFSTFNIKLPYEVTSIDFDKYDEIVLGTPTWAFTITPFIKKFLIENKFKNKKVTLLTTHMGGPGKIMKKFKKYVDSSNEIVDTISIQTGTDYENSTILKK